MKPSQILQALGAVLLSATLPAPLASAAPYMLVNCDVFGTPFVVRYELDSGEASMYGRYAAGTAPNNLAMDSHGVLFASLSGGNKNVVKFVPQEGTDVLSATDFTSTIGRFGPGQMQFYNGDLYVAADTERVVKRFDGATGALKGSLVSPDPNYNIRALAIDGDRLYYAEVFQDRGREFQLSPDPPSYQGLVFWDHTGRLEKAINVTIGPNQTLVLTDQNNFFVQQYSIITGNYLGPLVDVRTLDSAATGTWDIQYVPSLNNYFLSARNEVFRLDANGALLQTYVGPSTLTGLLVVVPEPSGVRLALLAVAILGALVHLNRATTAGRGRFYTPA